MQRVTVPINLPAAERVPSPAPPLEPVSSFGRRSSSPSLPNDSQGFQLPGFLQHFSPSPRPGRRGREKGSAGILEGGSARAPIPSPNHRKLCWDATIQPNLWEGCILNSFLKGGRSQRGACARTPSPRWDHDVFDGFNCSHFPLDWLNPQHIV